jgi:peptidoglycan/xylan/chitin deacetylase (PgdA/CDA1 family)
LSKEEEKAFIQDNVQTIKRVTGFQPVGWNAYWMRNSANTLEILQDLWFIYHIDDPSADEPFILPLRGKPFLTVPYTFHMNDISSFPFTQFDPNGYEQALKDEFDQLYEEGVNRRATRTSRWNGSTGSERLRLWTANQACQKIGTETTPPTKKED